MKKIFTMAMLALLVIGTAVSQTTVPLDEAVKSGAQNISDKLAKGTKVVVLNFNAPTAKFSNYVIEEVTMSLVNGGKLTVVDRKNLDLIQQEMNFQMSGEVDDRSAQAIGRKLGAQSIISGSLEDMGGYFRIRFRTINVQSAVVEALTSADITYDKRVAQLLGGNATSTTSMNPDGLRFSKGQKIGYGFLNLVGGLGSFIMGDVPGGLILLGGNVATYGVMLVPDESGAMVTVGSVIGLGVTVYAFVRPFSYDKKLAKKRQITMDILQGINVGILPASDGISAVQVSFKKRF